MFTFDSISGPFLFGKDMPTILGLRLMDAANGSALLQDIIDYTEMEDEEGAIIFLDQQKAFGRVDWGWIDLCFEKFGFSDCLLFPYSEIH
jgi:hypothetical protein